MLTSMRLFVIISSVLTWFCFMTPWDLQAQPIRVVSIDTLFRVQLRDNSMLNAWLLRYDSTGVIVRTRFQNELRIPISEISFLYGPTSRSEEDSLHLFPYDRIPVDSQKRVYLLTTGFYHQGYVHREPGWTIVYETSGRKEMIPNAEVRSVVPIEQAGPYGPLGIPRNMRPFDSYLVPMASVGASVPTGPEDLNGGLAYDLGVTYAFRGGRHFPGWLGGFALFAYDHRSVRFASVSQTLSGSEAEIISNYVSITPGIGYRGFFGAGLTVGVPVSSEAAVYSPDAATPYEVRTSLTNILIEPRVFLNIPISFAEQRELALTLSAGYPLKPFLNAERVTIGDLGIQTNDVRLPELQLGLSYILPFNGSNGYSM